jgi:carbonic anhydrase
MERSVTLRPAAEDADEGEPLERLLAGNSRFAAGESQHPRQTSGRRADLAQEQKPFAMVLACVDARVPPEIVFDQGLGDLYVVRTAGLALDNVAMGSLQYGVQVFRIPLLVVLGHARCLAVGAAIEAMEGRFHPTAQISAVTDYIRPAVDAVPRKPEEAWEIAIRQNVALTVGRLKVAPVLMEAVNSRALSIVGARYDLDTGKVEVVVPE